MHTVGPFLDSTSIMMMKLLLAAVLGSVIGTERSVLARAPAGTRTFGLVSLGACLFIIVSNYVDSSFVGITSFDPLHIAAAVVTGIGFIGGGLIIFRGDSVHGITTAAGLWIAAAVGTAIGFGMYSISLFATILVLLMFTGVWYVEERFKHWFETVDEKNKKISESIMTSTISEKSRLSVVIPKKTKLKTKRPEVIANI